MLHVESLKTEDQLLSDFLSRTIILRNLDPSAILLGFTLTMRPACLASTKLSVHGIRADGQISAGDYEPQYDADNARSDNDADEERKVRSPNENRNSGKMSSDTDYDEYHPIETENTESNWPAW
ncbi:hypothetical protein IMSHALPRED_004327 [Imshaugia aleurites]|uniref:Uncharacterized protein n=1 Tax=Imshaugia aleurites TaxID=172621 RepID=A0A8H3F9E0_9LECA|nr:hypothetical protein IMSHALPRED_004327 [Imshaugia aleurites]